MGNIVILTGAGISAESGISTFRDANGLWETYAIEEVASPTAFKNDPVTVHRFYNLRRAQLKTVQPNVAHKALAMLEQQWEGGFLLITQNVDDLHERAGSRNLAHMHGEIRKLRCTYCDTVIYQEDDAGEHLTCQTCRTSGGMRPDIVWFGEQPYSMDVIYTALAQADIFVAIGTSGQVYPAAALVAVAKRNGRKCTTIEINPVPTGAGGFDKIIAQQATIGVPEFVIGISKGK